MANKRELFCADSLDRFIANHLQISNKKWEPVPEGQDPPDFWLKLDQTAFAVEVTSTEVMRDASIGEGQVQEETYEHSHTQFIKDIENAAKAAGILKGVYAISFSRPMAVSRFRQIRREVQDELLQYIEQTQCLSASPNEVIRYSGQRVCCIGKLHDERDGVYEAFSDIAWVESPEVTDRVCDLLQAALADKKQKIQAKGESDPRLLSLPRILLLLNTYAFADLSMYLNCIQRVHSLEFFHSVFVIWGNGDCSLLYTSDKMWPKSLRS